MGQRIATMVVVSLAFAGISSAAYAGPTPHSGNQIHVAAPAPADGIASWSVDLDATLGTTTSPGITTSPFTLAALSWRASGAQPEHLELRVREGGAWGEWFELAVDAAPAPDGRIATEPFIADGATGAQARIESRGALHDLRLDLVHAETPSEQDVTSAAQAAKTPTGSELRPKIVPRKAWGADEKRTKPNSTSSWLKAMYVHHTAGPNSYSKERAPAVVRSIWAYHTLGRGWPDIGYQFLVDRFGTIYEGRRDSIAGLPMGAQAGGYNAYTLGVSVMGNFTSVSPSDTVVGSVVDVLAWQAHRWGLDPLGKVRLRTAKSTGSKTRWSPGKLTPRLPVIRGHRDTNHTACPGARLYAKLPAIRRAVDAKVERAVRKHGAAPPQLARVKVDPLAERARTVSLPSKVRLTWREHPGAVRYEVVRRIARHGGKILQPKYGWRVEKRTKKLKSSVKVPRGETWTLGVRAVDALGRYGKVRRVGTVTRPVADRLVERTGRWATKRQAKLFTGRASESRAKGAALVVRDVTDATAVVIVAATGPGRGRVAVHAGGKRVATVSLASEHTEPRARVVVPLPKTFSGTVRVVARDADRPVRISGLAFPRKHLS